MGKGGEEAVKVESTEAVEVEVGALPAELRQALSQQDTEKLQQLEGALWWTLHQVRQARRNLSRNQKAESADGEASTSSPATVELAQSICKQLSDCTNLVPKSLCTKDKLRKLKSRRKPSCKTSREKGPPEESVNVHEKKGSSSEVTPEWSDKEVESKAAGPPGKRRPPHEETKQLLRHVFHQNRITHVVLAYLVISTTVPLAFLRNLRCFADNLTGPFDKMRDHFKRKMFGHDKDGDLVFLPLASKEEREEVEEVGSPGAMTRAKQVVSGVMGAVTS